MGWSWQEGWLCWVARLKWMVHEVKQTKENKKERKGKRNIDRIPQVPQINYLINRVKLCIAQLVCYWFCIPCPAFLSYSWLCPFLSQIGGLNIDDKQVDYCWNVLSWIQNKNIYSASEFQSDMCVCACFFCVCWFFFNPGGTSVFCEVILFEIAVILVSDLVI